MGSFERFIQKNKDKLYKMAEKNTTYNSEGRAVIKKDDEWRNETEWDDLYKKLIKR